MSSRRRQEVPRGHSLYWVYVYTKTRGYNFDTAKTLTAAREALAWLMREFKVTKDSPDLDMAVVFYGDENGAFTHLDAAVPPIYGPR